MDINAGGAVAGGRLRVLLVDDHGDSLDVLRTLLESRGYSVTTADSVTSALRIARPGAFDALVSDIRLRDGTGYDIVRATGPIAAIAVSAADGPDDIARSHAAGFTSHLVKPISIEVLLGLLERIRPIR